MKKLFIFVALFVLLSTLVFAGSYTSHYNLYKPSAGESGWAGSVNSNFDTIDTLLFTNADTPTYAGLTTTGTHTVGHIYISAIGDLETYLTGLPGTGTVTSVASADSNLTVSGATGTVVITLNTVPFAKLINLPTTLAGYGITNAQPLSAVLTQMSTACPEGQFRKTIGGVQTCSLDQTGSAPAFSAVTSGSSSATYTMSGGSLRPTGAAVIEATTVPWSGVTGTPVFVPATRTINGSALSSDVTLTAGQIGAVPSTRTVNGTALSSDITITAGQLAEDETHRWATDAEKATWNGYTVLQVAGGLLSYASPTLTLESTAVQSRVTGTAPEGYAISTINENGTVEVVAVGGNIDLSEVASGIATGQTFTIGTGSYFMAGGGQIQATEIVSSETPTYSLTFALLGLSADREITVPNRALTLDNITTSTTSDITGLLYSNGTSVSGVTLGTNLTLTDGVLDSTGGEGAFAVTTSKITTDTTLSAANFGGSGLNPIKVTTSRLKLPTAAANLMRSISSKGTSTIWPASASDVITLNGTDLTAGNQVQCTGGLWVYGFGANDWSIDGSGCSDGGKPVLTSNPTPTLAFGSVSTATTSTVGFTNTGTALATLGTPTLSGTDLARFSLNNGCSSTLATSATCSVGVTFDATVGGPYAASLDFPYYNTTKSVAITGTGTSATGCVGGLIFSWDFENYSDITQGTPAGCSVGDTSGTVTGSAVLSTTQKHDGTYAFTNPPATANSYYTFSVSGEDIFKNAQGTVEGWVYASAWSNGIYIIRVPVDANNYFYIDFAAGPNELKVHRSAGGSAKVVTTASGGLLTSTWYHFTVKWDNTPHSGNYLQICADTTTGTTNCGNDTSGTGTWAGTISELSIGNRSSNSSQYYMDSLKIYSTWQ